MYIIISEGKWYIRLRTTGQHPLGKEIKKKKSAAGFKSAKSQVAVFY